MYKDEFKYILIIHFFTLVITRKYQKYNNCTEKDI